MVSLDPPPPALARTEPTRIGLAVLAASLYLCFANLPYTVLVWGL